jgi:hypothetical protein
MVAAVVGVELQHGSQQLQRLVVGSGIHGLEVLGRLAAEVNGV